MSVTARFGLRAPDLSDAPNGPAQIATLASDVDGWLCRAYRCTSSTRPTGIPDDFIIRESDTGLLYIWDGSAWVQIAGGTSGGGGSSGSIGTVSATYTATSVQPIPNNADTVIAFGTDAVTDSAVTKSTSGPGHKFTLNQTRLWVISATLRFVENGTGGRMCELKAGSTTLAKMGFDSSASNPFTATVSCARRLTSGTQITLLGWQNSGGSLALEPNGGNTVHIDIAGV